MNILLIGPINQSCGWGRSSLDFLKALLKTSHKVHARPIYLGSSYNNELDKIEEVQAKLDNYDAVIQIALPNFLSYNKNFGKNIGMSFFETANIQYTGWIKNINLMDAYFVSSQVEKTNLINSGVTIPIYVIGPIVNTSKFESKYNTIIGLERKSFKFYTIGEYNSRKNLSAAVIAFHREFNRSDNVDLVIKPNIPGQTAEQIFNIVANDLRKIKENLRLYRDINEYKKEIILTGELGDEQICELHTSCDCFVSPSFGESISRPALDSMGFSNVSIVTDNTGMTEFVNKKNGYLIKSEESELISQNIGLEDVYSSYETWQKPSILDLQKQMRSAYNNRNNKKKNKLAVKTAYEYSYDKAAERINKCLALL